ncbi:lipopolysaccharide biosynthesis protein [Compostibacter hankyongensis]|uniref:Polysaccharide biosynthesis protein C-terminal domain-containing protein n=1 Tax=Compostibacter hankyongensis TaxID=1007089 RepID=A0ABP8G5X9_9BACT
MGIVRQQSIRSSIFIYIGFAVGAFNLLVLFTRYLTPEQYGMLNLVLNFAVLASSIATLGTVPVINKFFPFYNDYLSPKKNDLPFLTAVICGIGFLLFVLASVLFEGLIIRKFGKNSALFVQYYYLVYPTTFFLLLFTLLESFAWGIRKTVLSNFLRETAVKVYPMMIILLVALGWISFGQFAFLYSLLYVIPCLVLLFYLAGTGRFKIHPSISHVTRRLRGKMLIFSAYIFSGSIFNSLSKTLEQLFIASINGLGDTARYTLADYIIRVMEVPQRSMAAITTPLLAAHWKNKAYGEIRTLYQKSAVTLLIFGIFILGLIWTNVGNLLLFLPRDFSRPAIRQVILILGIGKLVDLATGINNQLIQTSNYWRFDFFSNITFILLSIPLNFVLVHRFGIIGASLTISFTLILFNLMRFCFIWWKFRFQPFTGKTLLVLAWGVVAYGASRLFPYLGNLYVDTLVRSLVFGPVFAFGILRWNASDDVTQLWQKWKNKLLHSGSPPAT